MQHHEGHIRGFNEISNQNAFFHIQCKCCDILLKAVNESKIQTNTQEAKYQTLQSRGSHVTREATVQYLWWLMHCLNIVTGPGTLLCLHLGSRSMMNSLCITRYFATNDYILLVPTQTSLSLFFGFQHLLMQIQCCLMLHILPA